MAEVCSGSSELQINQPPGHPGVSDSQTAEFTAPAIVEFVSNRGIYGIPVSAVGNSD
jgi:hypothetical protein